jgi:hypothetical protein
MPEDPVPQKDLRQLLRDSVNSTAANVGKTGFEAIDELARRGHKKLADIGITVSPELTEQAVFNLKKLIVRGMKGNRHDIPPAARRGSGSTV